MLPCSNNSTSVRPLQWRRSDFITATCTAMLVLTAAWHGTLTVPGMAYPAPGITQQVHMQRGKLSTQGEVSTVQKNYRFEGLFVPFFFTFNEKKLFFNLNKLPQLYSVHKHKHSQVAIFVPIPFDVLSCTLSRTEHPLSDLIVLAHFVLKLPHL